MGNSSKCSQMMPDGQCQIINNMIGREYGPVDKSVCDYCIKHNTNPELCTINNEPFKSIRTRQAHLQNVKYDINDNGCHLLQPLSTKGKLSLSEYIIQDRQCRKFGVCTISKVDDRVACQHCMSKFVINHHYESIADIDKLLPIQARYGDPVKKWAIGVTSAPRQIPTITRCISGFLANGLESGIIFSEPGQQLQFGTKWPVVYRQERLGIFSNFILGLHELFLRNMDADVYVMAQDDCVLVDGAREYLERFLWPCDGPHTVSLFAADYQETAETKNQFGWRRCDKWFGSGPLMILMPHEVVTGILSDIDIAHKWCAYAKSRGSAADDIGIFMWSIMNKSPIYYPWPTMAEHVAKVSTHGNINETVNWSTQVIGPPAILDFNHYYLVNPGNYRLRESIEKIGGKIITDIHTKLPNRNNAITIIKDGYIINRSLEYDIKREFDYSGSTILHCVGYDNGDIVYDSSVCRTIASTQHSFDDKCIEGKPAWSRE